jgi:hypothetical protein
MTGTNRRLALLARGGYAARGVVYIIVGGLALLAAFGQGGGQTTDTQGALTSLLTQPFGEVLLAVVALGLLGYALWRVVQALTDVDHHGTDPKGLAIRAGLLVSAATHGLLAAFALSLIFGWGSRLGGADSGARDWTAWLMQQPFGRWLVGLIGLAIVGAGIAHMIKGYRSQFEKYFEMGPAALEKVSPVCRFGLIARGAVFVIIGAFLLVAAVQLDSAQARGLQGALETLQRQPYGWILLGIVALGLMAFGVYSLIEAWYRRIDVRYPNVALAHPSGRMAAGRALR